MPRSTSSDSCSPPGSGRGSSAAACRPGPHFLQLDDRALTGLLADTQDANAELAEQLQVTEARLRDCQDRLQAARSGMPAHTDPTEETP